jgi:hypothetical protein
MRSVAAKRVRKSGVKDRACVGIRGVHLARRTWCWRGLFLPLQRGLSALHIVRQGVWLWRAWIRVHDLGIIRVAVKAEGCLSHKPKRPL